MGYIILDKEKDGEMRQNMRRTMRGDYRYHGGASMTHDGDGWEHGYRMGYRHGWEDKEDDEEEKYRRLRDSRGRYV